MKPDTIILSAILLALFSVIGCGSKNSAPTGPGGSSSTTVTGVITDYKASTPVAGASITIGSQSATSDASGSYSITSVTTGQATVSVTAPGYTDYIGSAQVSGTTQTLNFSITAVQVSVPFSYALDPRYYAYYPLNLAGYSYYHYNSSGLGTHNVKITIQISSAPSSVYLAFVRPDGYYDVENTSAGAGFSQTITTNACGNWAPVLWNQGVAQVSVSGTMTIDFSNYLPQANDLASSVLVPVNYQSISAGTSASFVRFLQANLNYNLSLNISGGSGNDINLDITNADGNSVFNQRVSGAYNSQTFVATKFGFYTFAFDNSFSTISSKSVTGNLKITH
jgi:hypothetical protein